MQNQDQQIDSAGIESLVYKLTNTEVGIKFAWDMVMITEKERQEAHDQLYHFAADMQKLVADRDVSEFNESEKDAAYAQLECFNRDFLHLMRQRETAYAALESSHLDTLRRLAIAAEYKDDDTGVHILRMSRFAGIIARAYGQNEEFCNMIEQGSPMHDIGKIGIPDNVLKKPGKLNEEEWKIMRMHPDYGANILGGSDVPVIQMAEQVARTHHEKYDGSGYPLGLKGEEIPLSGRIVALADFFDALTMDRCYRPAFSDEKAFSMVKENSGTHFDPEIVNAFFSVSDKIIETRDRINQENKYRSVSV